MIRLISLLPVLAYHGNASAYNNSFIFENGHLCTAINGTKDKES